MLKAREKHRTRHAGTGPPSSMKRGDERDFMLIAFQCDKCGGIFVAKEDSRSWRENIRCKCGNQIIVLKERHARGKCRKCRSPFYNMIVINDLKRIKCRNCSSDIDLFIGRDGKFTA